MSASFFAVLIGGAAGCLLRWFLAIQLNHLFPNLPPGTLVANLVGGFIIGLAIAFFAGNPQLSPAWKLLITTGFCGGLTTFSTFSAEIVTHLQSGRLLPAISAIFIHVLGSLIMTALGMWVYRLARG
ncbi:fluoride efflux transporter CrcB [Frateuria aurantia]